MDGSLKIPITSVIYNVSKLVIPMLKLNNALMSITIGNDGDIVLADTKNMYSMAMKDLEVKIAMPISNDGIILEMIPSSSDPGVVSIVDTNVVKVVVLIEAKVGINVLPGMAEIN